MYEIHTLLNILCDEWFINFTPHKIRSRKVGYSLIVDDTVVTQMFEYLVSCLSIDTKVTKLSK